MVLHQEVQQPSARGAALPAVSSFNYLHAVIPVLHMALVCTCTQHEAAFLVRRASFAASSRGNLRLTRQIYGIAHPFVCFFGNVRSHSNKRTGADPTPSKRLTRNESAAALLDSVSQIKFKPMPAA